jgi:hypothetical protein
MGIIYVDYTPWVSGNSGTHSVLGSACEYRGGMLKHCIDYLVRKHKHSFMLQMTDILYKTFRKLALGPSSGD